MAHILQNRLLTYQCRAEDIQAKGFRHLLGHFLEAGDLVVHYENRGDEPDRHAVGQSASRCRHSVR